MPNSFSLDYIYIYACACMCVWSIYMCALDRRILLLFAFTKDTLIGVLQRQKIGEGLEN